MNLHSKALHTRDLENASRPLWPRNLGYILIFVPAIHTIVIRPDQRLHHYSPSFNERYKNNLGQKSTKTEEPGTARIESVRRRELTCPIHHPGAGRGDLAVL